MATVAAPPLPAAQPRSAPSRILYPYAQWYFFAAMVVTWLGFSHSYFAVIRSEPLLHHIHGILMGGWIGILILQPILYQRGKLRLHRTIGRWAVYLWVPAMVVCGLLMDRRMIRTHSVPPSILDQLAFLDLTSLILLPTLIVLSIVYARNIQLHARYIVCTVLLLIPPALARLLFVVPGMHSFQTNGNTAEAITVLILLVLTMDDKRRGHIWPPYPAAAIVFAVLAVAANYAKTWPWWQALSGWIAST